MNSCELLDLEAQDKRWKVVSSLNEARKYAMLALFPSRGVPWVYCFGGVNKEREFSTVIERAAGGEALWEVVPCK